MDISNGAMSGEVREDKKVEVTPKDNTKNMIIGGTVILGGIGIIVGCPAIITTAIIGAAISCLDKD